MDVGDPKDLMNVYFVPGGNRFVVSGMQTLQIWTFPTDRFNYYHLEFIWSRPKMTDDTEPNPYRSELVGEYYHCIPQPKIYRDSDTGNIEVNFKFKEEGNPHCVTIPAARGSKTHSTFLHCARSIHLLAAAYAYSRQQAKKTSKDSSQETMTFEQHAMAIALFAGGHINRLLSEKDYGALRLICEDQETRVTSTSHEKHSNQSKVIVSVLTLLLDRSDLKDANHSFVEGLLDVDN
ncbi:hypothetical protein BGZ65_012747, partial [Modicella reniformis]